MLTLAEITYRAWLYHPELDEDAKQSLEDIANQSEEIEECFYKDLEFGTAGLRGIMGMGTNRMNRYTVVRAATGFAQYIASLGEEARERGIAISYDSRHNSAEFARLSARVFCANKIKVRLSDELRPVPVLSFAIRHYDCVGGIVLTASHNPKIYNGFKAYGEGGAQIPVEVSDEVVKKINAIIDPITLYHNLPSEEECKASPYWISMGEELDQAYDEMAMGLLVNPEVVEQAKDLAIVYSPLHGTGNKPVSRLLAKMGFKNVSVVPEQALPDGDFPTAPYPNPEDPAAMQFGIDLAKEKLADILIATDPDADRMGVALRNKENEYVLLSGNEIGILLMEYLLSSLARKNRLPEHPMVVSTVVSSRLPERICEDYGVKLYRSLTGFKNIAEVIKARDDEGSEEVIFSYEESFGYLVGKGVRDKDGVTASMLMAEIAAYAAAHGETIFDRLQRIFEKYGFVAEKTVALKREGREGQELIKSAMKKIREEKHSFFQPLQAKVINDYLLQESWKADSAKVTALPLNKSDVLVYGLGGSDWFATRPSGTEPKLKVYLGASAPTQAEADEKLQTLEEIAAKRIEELL